MTAGSVPLLPEPRSASFDGALVEPGETRTRRTGGLVAQGYRLTIRPDGAVEIDAADDAGAFYAAATLAQLARRGGGRVPVGRIEDWPDVAVRGVMLDVSRDKVPTMDTLCSLIDRLASWKVNHVQLYMEHTFAYPGHEEVWRSASPYTPDDIAELDAFCAQRHVELAPNQNCLGHMERWLRHERYRQLAIQPEGTERLGRMGPPTTLDPAKPGSLALASELLGELLPHFASRRVHVGLDEPWELTADRHEDYAEWIVKLRALPALRDHEMLVWGDIIAAQPALATTLPDDVTVCEWGYEDIHPFDARAAALAENVGRAPWVCPGTSSWLSILGRWSNAKGNLANAASAAARHGAAGYLVTDWGDLGHLQPPAVGEPPLAYAAAVAWCEATNRDLDVAAAVDEYVVGDSEREFGEALLSLGDAYRHLTPQTPNMASVVMPLYFPQIHVGRGPLAGATPDEYDAVSSDLAAARGRLRRAHIARADGALALDELGNAIDTVELMCDDARHRLEGDGSLESVSLPRRRALAERLDAIAARHRELWVLRNRPGGLDDSARRFEELAGAYRTGDTAGIGGW